MAEKVALSRNEPRDLTAVQEALYDRNGGQARQGSVFRIEQHTVHPSSSLKN